MASEKEASEELALEETVVGLLKKKKMTLSLAESCTCLLYTSCSVRASSVRFSFPYLSKYFLEFSAGVIVGSRGKMCIRDRFKDHPVCR